MIQITVTKTKSSRANIVFSKKLTIPKPRRTAGLPVNSQVKPKESENSVRKQERNLLLSYISEVEEDDASKNLQAGPLFFVRQLIVFYLKTAPLHQECCSNKLILIEL